MLRSQFPETSRALPRNLLGTVPESLFQLRADFTRMRGLLNHRIECAATARYRNLVGMIPGFFLDELDVERRGTVVIERRRQEKIFRDVFRLDALNCHLDRFVSHRLFEMHMDINKWRDRSHRRL